MSTGRDDEFYVGYLPTAPTGIGVCTRTAVAVVLVLSAAIAAVLALSQRPFGDGTFEFGVSTGLSGVIVGGAHPLLLVPEGDGWSTHLLSAFGKHGADALVADFDGQAVRIRGSLIYRDDATMLEVEAGSIERLDGAAGDALLARDRPSRVSLGRHTLTGEIVDSKCFLGVMKPGNLKPHRACATRCISGGVPPVLLVRDGEGLATYYLLVGENGEAINDRVLPYVAEPVTISGRIERRDDLLVIHADPDEIRRITS